MSVSSKGGVAISVSPGSTATGSDELTLTTNCSSGYVVYASATSSSASTSLSNGSGSEISASSNTLVSPGSLSDNTWGIANASNYAEGKFAGLPTYANMATTALTSSNSSVSSSKIPVYYGVKVTSDTAPGTYTGNVLYTAMVNSSCYAYTVHFDSNGGSGEMADQEFLRSESKALSPNTFSRSGYTFRGWSTTSTGGVIYKDGEIVSGLKENNGDEITLYAIWTDDSLAKLQDFTQADCKALSGSLTLEDIRDGSVYTVRRLADGNCWFTQNLKLVNAKLTSNDSNVSFDSSNYSYNFTIPDSNIKGFTEDNETVEDKRAAYADGTYGGYYNFYTATAGYSWYRDDKESGTSDYDICPKNWRLPIGNNTTTGNEFSVLDIAVNGDSAGTGRADAESLANLISSSSSYPNFALAGYASSSIAKQGTLGHYWSATVGNSYSGKFLYLDSYDTVNPHGNNSKYLGRSVRCMMTGEKLGTLQDFDETSSLPNAGDSTVLLDARDKNTYSVKRLADGKVWMTQNLRLSTTTGTSGTLELATDTSQGEGTIEYKEDLGTDITTAYARYNGNYTYGTYYQWTTAQLVCPKGWHLPSGGADGEFAKLDIAINPHDSLKGTNRESGTSGVNLEQLQISSDNMTDASSGSINPGFTLAGYYFGDTTLYGYGSRGYYWAATAYSSENGYHLRLRPDNLSVTPQYNNLKYDGLSVRCIADYSSAYSIVYDANGGTGEAIKTDSDADKGYGDISAEAGATITIATHGTLAKDGYTLQGWGLSASTSTVSYATGETSVSVDALAAKTNTPEGGTITLYAVWKKNPTNYTTESTCTSAGGKFIGNKCWKLSSSKVTWANRASACTGKWTVPSIGDYDIIMGYYNWTYSGSLRWGIYSHGTSLYNNIGLSENAYLWSSTELSVDTSKAYVLFVGGPVYYKDYYTYYARSKTESDYVLCLAS